LASQSAQEKSAAVAAVVSHFFKASEPTLTLSGKPAKVSRGRAAAGCAAVGVDSSEWQVANKPLSEGNVREKRYKFFEKSI